MPQKSPGVAKFLTFWGSRVHDSQRVENYTASVHSPRAELISLMTHTIYGGEDSPKSTNKDSSCHCRVFCPETPWKEDLCCSSWVNSACTSGSEHFAFFAFPRAPRPARPQCTPSEPSSQHPPMPKRQLRLCDMRPMSVVYSPTYADFSHGNGNMQSLESNQ